MPSSPPRTRAALRRGLAAACVLAGLIAAPSALGATGGTGEPESPPATTPAPAPAPAPPVPAPAPTPAPPSAETVSIGLEPAAAGRAVPARFLGLSFEAGSLELIGQLGEKGNLVSYLRSLGPGVMRFGGITADQNVAWVDSQTPRPAWASATIGPADMRSIGRLARRSGWTVLLTVGLAHFEPQAAAREVAAAKKALGPYLAGVEIGNEPDALGKHGFRPMPWLAQGYEEQVSAYREEIAKLVPEVAIAGPDVSGSGAFPEWGAAEALAQQPALLTGHHYPLGCNSTPAPTIPGLLNPALRGREAQSLETYVGIARAQGIPLRIDEANSVSCGGVSGVSDTFGAALWATGYIGQAMAAGAAGLNLHGHPLSCSGYSELCLPDPALASAGRLHAQPDWYALLLARTLIGYRPMPTKITAAGAPNLAATGFTGPNHTVKLLLSDDDAPGSLPLVLRIGVGAGLGEGGVLRLTDGSPYAKDGVRIGGREVSAAGTWHEPAGEPVRVSGGYVTVKMAPSSAALVTVAPKPQRCGRKQRPRRGETACRRNGAARPAPPRR
jgi:hypothetical protein